MKIEIYKEPTNQPITTKVRLLQDFIDEDTVTISIVDNCGVNIWHIATISVDGLIIHAGIDAKNSIFPLDKQGRIKVIKEEE